MATFVFNPPSENGGSSGSGGASAEEIERLDAVNNSQNTLISELIAVNGSQDAGIASLNTRFVSVASVNSIQNTAISALDGNVSVIGDELVATNARVAGVKAYTDGLQPKITTTATSLGLNADTINIATDPELYQEVNISGFGDTVNINPSVLNLATVGSAVVNIGTGSAPNVINIGGVDDTVNIAGNLVVFETTNTAIKDKIVSLNRGGGVATGFNTGFEVEENGVATGYIKTNGDASQWLVKAPVGNEFSLMPVAEATPNTLVGRDANGYTALNGLITPVVQTLDSSGSSIQMFANAPDGVVFMSLDTDGLSFDNLRSGTVNDLTFFNSGDSLKLRQEKRVGNGEKLNETFNTIPELQIRQGEVRMGVIGEKVSALSAKQLILNSEGESKSSEDAGIVVRQDGVDDAYIKINGNRDKWLCKAPSGDEFELIPPIPPVAVVGEVPPTANTLVSRTGSGAGRFTTVLAEGSGRVATLRHTELFSDNFTLSLRSRWDNLLINDVELRLDPVARGARITTRYPQCSLSFGAINPSSVLQNGFINLMSDNANKFNTANPTEFQLVDTNFNFMARFGSVASSIGGSLNVANGLTVGGIDMTPTTAIATGNWFRVRTTPNFTISFRRYGDLVFWSIPPCMDVLNPTNPIHNASSTFDYFEFTSLIPVGFRPLASSNQSLIAVAIWNGNAVANAFNLAYVNMSSNGLIVVQLPNGQTFNTGQLAGWHTSLQGSYRIV